MWWITLHERLCQRGRRWRLVPKKKPNTIFQKLYDAIKYYKVSPATKKVLEDIAKSTLKSLARLLLASKINTSKVKGTIKKYAEKVADEIKKDVKKKVK